MSSSTSRCVGEASQAVVDARGKACPVPVIELARAVGHVAVGDTVAVLADDPGAKVDIPVWCRMRGHDLLSTVESGGGWCFEVRRTT